MTAVGVILVVVLWLSLIVMVVNEIRDWRNRLTPEQEDMWRFFRRLVAVNQIRRVL